MKTKKIVTGAVIAALYTALCLALPALSYGTVQVRFSEALTLLPVLLPGGRVERGAQVRDALLGENCRVGAEARVGAAPEDCDPADWGLAVLAPECGVAPGRKVKAGIMLNKRGEERAK